MLNQLSRKTKVVWSYTSSQLTSPEAITTLAQQAAQVDADVIRLSFDRQYIEEIEVFLKEYNEFSCKSGLRRPVMLDMGPVSRAYLCKVEEDKELVFGETITLSSVKEKDSFYILSDYWEDLFVEGYDAFLAYGNIQLKIMKVEHKAGVHRVRCRVEQGGRIYSDMPVHVPGTRLTSHLSRGLQKLDLKEMKRLAQLSIDYLVMPGISDIEDIQELRGIFQIEDKAEPWMLLKIDSHDVAKRVHEYLEEIHGVYVSRRDLALTTDPATVPMITKEIIQLCNEHAKLIVTASEILGSMRYQPTPTRAEVSDLANAVIDGTDAVVLAEEIPAGPYLERAFDVVDRVIKDVERKNEVEHNWGKADPAIKLEMDAVAFGAFHTARRVGAKAIVCLTELGNTALKLSSFRPPVDVIAVSSSHNTCSRMSLVRGVDGMLLDKQLGIHQVLDVINNQLIEQTWLEEGDLIVFVSVTLSSISRTDSNLFTVQKLSKS